MLMTTRAEQYIDNLTAVGEISFTMEKLCRELGISHGAGLVAVQRLSKQKKIATPSKGYYLILTPEFRGSGCLPADFFIDSLMRHLNKKYYVSLLSAALYHGAAHQQPQMFQVIIEGKKEIIHCGNICIEFIKNIDLQNMPIKKIKTRTGFMNVSTPEGTAMDLMRYMRQCGGINRVATVIEELSETMVSQALVDLAEKTTERAWIHRLGFLLDRFGFDDLAAALYEKRDKNFNRIVSLVPYAKITGTPRNKKWKIAVNANVESDLDDTN